MILSYGAMVVYLGTIRTPLHINSRKEEHINYPGPFYISSSYWAPANVDHFLCLQFILLW